jgi:hypothetical protein
MERRLMKMMEEENKIENETALADEWETSDIGSNHSTYKGNKTSKPFIAGILLIIAGVLGILSGISMYYTDINSVFQSIDPNLFQGQNITAADIQNVLNICSIALVIISIIPILGGILSIQRRSKMAVLACSIIGIFTIGPVFLSSIMALIATILIAMEKTEFKKKEIPMQEYDESFK